MASVPFDAPKRPVLRYHGGKFMLRKWIASYFPEHKVYVEPYGGAASVLLAKKRSYAEIYNDMDGEIVNFFRVLREHGNQLRQKLELTPFARDEFMEAYEPSDGPLEQARRTAIKSFMGFGSNGIHRLTGFRSNSTKSGTTPAHDWVNYPGSLDAVISRLQGVVIENRPAIDCMSHHDSPDTLHYVDPPYMLATRSDKGHDYKHELDDDAHEELLNYLNNTSGMVVLSGYRSPMYDDMLSTWTRIDKQTHADGAKDRTESLWLSPNVAVDQPILL